MVIVLAHRLTLAFYIIGKKLILLKLVFYHFSVQEPDEMKQKSPKRFGVKHCIKVKSIFCLF